MVQSIRGMRDVLPEEGRRWRVVEDAIRAVLTTHAYEEVHLPLLEATELFSRGVGEATDIVEKEMYTLADRDGDSISLRPEGTAVCARALLQHGLLHNQTQRVFYAGPMFRYERPQKGRYRQFYQIGAEAFGLAGPDVDAELILMCQLMWKALGISGETRLEINTLGSGAARAAYRAALVGFLTPLAAGLDADSQRRLGSNPLRILDSKVEQTQDLLAGAPSLEDFIDDEGKAHFSGLCELLEQLDVPFEINPKLVRGLDYYTHTVFEWKTDALGAQDTICAGGRYDGLVELLGGRPTPGAGFALGVERVLLLHEQRFQGAGFAAAADVYCCVLDDRRQSEVFAIAQKLRDALPGLRIRTHAGGGKLKSQMRRADASGARLAVLVGEDEIAKGVVSLKYLRESREQESVPAADLETVLAEYFA
ncbi:MAG TPA: histidine--tRNA ligase [Pseudomonadales bacterium]|jgi:histidyl-tRNA synthetase